MIFRNIDFHNVVEMEATSKGYELRRLPKSVRDKVNDGVKDNIFGTGIELRFKMLSGKCDIFLQADCLEEASVACVYFGSFQGGWQYSTKLIYDTPTKIHLEYPPELDKLLEMSKRNNNAFSPEVVRIILPYTRVRFIKAEGDIIPPEKNEVPDRTYLAYGSSITHGSLGLLQPYSYPFRISQKLNCDYINLGFAGCALMEKEIAEYIVSRKDWTFASVEMGINALGNKRFISDDEFEKRIDTFTSILASDGRPVFATSIFKFNGELQERGELFRNIVEKYARERLIYTSGLDLLDDEMYISADMTHPSLEGLENITNKWYEIIRKKI